MGSGCVPPGHAATHRRPGLRAVSWVLPRGCPEGLTPWARGRRRGEEAALPRAAAPRLHPSLCVLPAGRQPPRHQQPVWFGQIQGAASQSSRSAGLRPSGTQQLSVLSLLCSFPTAAATSRHRLRGLRPHDVVSSRGARSRCRQGVVPCWRLWGTAASSLCPLLEAPAGSSRLPDWPSRSSGHPCPAGPPQRSQGRLL